MTELESKLEDFVKAHLPTDPPDITTDKIVHDSVWGTVRMNRHEVALLDTPLMQRLRHIHQTSFAYLTYPSAVHTRFEHSIGCLHLASRYIEELRQKMDKLISDEVEFNTRAAALLHDIGHGPFSHTSEEIYRHLPQMLDFKKNNPTYENAKPHEILSALIIKTSVFRGYIKKVNAKFELSLDPDRIASAITATSPCEQQFESDIINGAFDVDKIDYTFRDCRLIGLPVAIDLHRLFTAVNIYTDSKTNARKLTIDIKSEITLEQIVFGKITLFTSVYRHHKARACDCLFKGINEYIQEHTEAKLNGSRLETPVDFLYWTDNILIQEGTLLKDKHPALHELLHGLAFRRIPCRALAIAPEYVVDKEAIGFLSLLELRHNKKEHILEQRKIALEIWEKAGKPCQKEFIWFDLPKPPSFDEGKETSIKKPDNTLCPLNELFDVDQWSEHYDQHKWVGHVFAPKECAHIISKTARDVLLARGIKLKPIAWQICHIKD